MNYYQQPCFHQQPNFYQQPGPYVQGSPQMQPSYAMPFQPFAQPFSQSQVEAFEETSYTDCNEGQGCSAYRYRLW